MLPSGGDVNRGQDLRHDDARRHALRRAQQQPLDARRQPTRQRGEHERGGPDDEGSSTLDPVTDPDAEHKHECEANTLDSDHELKPSSTGLETGANRLKCHDDDREI